MDDALFDADQIRAASFIRHVEIHDTLGSTNDRAAELVRQTGIELPALVVARHQTAGRGRGSNAWWSAEGALTFSALLDPTSLGIEMRQWPQVSLATAVAVCDALTQELNPQPEDANSKCYRLGIKWPNDVMLYDGKVCGILIESPAGNPSAKDRLIIGVGINLNNSWLSAPCELRANGAALCDTTRRKHDLQTVLLGTLAAVEERMSQLAAKDSRLSSAWQRLCWLNGQCVEHHDGSRRIAGICRGIDAEGALLLEDVDGVQRLVSGSVRTGHRCGALPESQRSAT
jgi:BirA family transcriptional regulator, biotin operon repressor / biotin---[acetyl-CoA-carboxylase] ligase